MLSITGATAGHPRISLAWRGWPRQRWSGIAVRLGCYVIWMEKDR